MPLTEKSFKTFFRYLCALVPLIFAENLDLSAQERMHLRGGSISGVVLDSISTKPMEYANIILFSDEDKKMVTGIITGKDGNFLLSDIAFGKYFADINFIGFEKKRIDDITIGQNNRHQNLGKIILRPTAIAMNAVVVQGDPSPISYQIDKKVVDVSQMQTVVSGNVADVLQNVPSISVDADGTVSLRGSSDFTVLIDGRPTILDPQDVLQQLPATSIQTIEIITNPSAKYKPEGTSGIINILLKKTKDAGLNGISHLNIGLNDKYGGDFLVEYKNDLFTSSFGADYNKRFSPGYLKREEMYTIQGNTTTTNSDGDTRWGRIFWGLRGGLEFNLGENDILGLGARFGKRKMERSSILNFSEKSQTGSLYFKNIGDLTRGGNFYDLNANYEHKFETEGHDIKAQLSYGNHSGDEWTLTESIFNSKIFDGKKTSEAGPSDEVEGRIEYTLPFGTTSKYEAGYEGQVEVSNEKTGLFEFDTLSYAYVFLPLYSHDTRNTESEHSLYSLYSFKWNNFGVQGGIRGEYTYRVIKLADQNQSFITDKWDIFPSFHASYEFKSGHQLMASYTRRIRRPGGWSLEPFLTWMDASNVQQGNPALKNEYIDSYEAGIQTALSNIYFSTEAYYRFTHNKIEQVRSAYSGNVTLTTFENVGSDYSLGNEFQITCELFSIWNLNLIGNIYQYKVEGTLSGVPFSRESFNWNARCNNVLRFSASTQIQLNTIYNSPSVSSQGKREGFFTTDLSLRQNLFDRTISLILQIRDLFKTGKQEFTTQGSDYYNHNYSTGEAPMVMLSIKYLFNNYSKEERHERPEDGLDEGNGY